MADPSFTCCPPVSRHQLDNNAVFLSSLQPLFTVGWPVFYFIHTQPNIALLLTSFRLNFSPLWHHQKLFAVLVIVICFHFSKNKSYCCPVSWLGLLSLSSLWKSCPRNFTEIAEISTKKLSGWLTAARLIVPVARFSPVRSNLLISTPALSNFHPSGNWAWLPLLTWRKEPIPARGYYMPGILTSPFCQFDPGQDKAPIPSHPIPATRRATIWHPKLLLAHLIISHRFLLLSFVLNLLLLKGSTWHRHRHRHCLLDSPI